MAVLEGAAELSAMLRTLPVEVRQNVLRPAAIAGARIVRDQIKALAPVSGGLGRRRPGGRVTAPGVLKRAVVLKFAKEKSGPDAATYVVAVRHGKSQQRSNRDAFYYLWVEEGHNVVRRRDGPVVGKAAPHPFIVPGYRATAAVAREKMKATMEEGVAQVIRLQGARRGIA